MRSIPESDLQHILINTESLWGDIANKNILVTGGTGFFGKWIIKSFIYINQKLSLNAKLYILSRNPQRFLTAHPQFVSPDVVYIQGNVCDFIFPNVQLHYIIHAATEASAVLNVDQPMFMFDTIVNGTKHVLELAADKNVVSLLLTSSGAIYGKQPMDITHLPEDINIAPDVFEKDSAYGEGKRVAELLCGFYFNKHNVSVKIARCFAFAGPYLPLDAHFAIGNFINDALNGTQIKINGDGSPYRSYLYASDLVIWLWTILLKGTSNRAYNVGSDEEINLLSLANKISNLTSNKLEVDVKQKMEINAKPSRYVPSIKRAKDELGLKVLVDIDTALKKTYDFYNQTN
jgi:nucleoside-diphosphate-sugar epimerase